MCFADLIKEASAEGTNNEHVEMRNTHKNVIENP
jgi:hypothetical protein